MLILKKKMSNDKKYIAMIIEPRKHRALEYVLTNVLENLDEKWKIIVFHGNKNGLFVHDIINNKLERWKHRIKTVHLNIDNLTLYEYSLLFVTRSVIYDYLEDSEYFLVFQTDSMIISKNKHLLDEFLNEDYDYVGAPWIKCNYEPTKQRDFIGNGGFSLRKTRTMLKILETYDYKNVDRGNVEDLFFSMKFDKIRTKKPSYERAMQFSIEEVFSPLTFACHKTWATPHVFNKLKELYPEVQTLKDLQGVVEDYECINT